MKVGQKQSKKNAQKSSETLRERELEPPAGTNDKHDHGLGAQATMIDPEFGHLIDLVFLRPRLMGALEGHSADTEVAEGPQSKSNNRNDI